MGGRITVDDRAARRSFDRFAKGSKRPKQVLLKQQSKLFVRDVVKVTPPNKGGKFNPKGGKATVSADIAKIFRPSKKTGISNPAGVHKKHRNRQGRVRARLKTDSKDDRYLVRNLKGYVNKVLARVGILASGWNAAAVALGLSLPTWISRHGNKYGRVKIKQGASSGSVTITNGVRFAGDIRGMDRRVQWAIDNRGRQMDKQMENLAIKKAAKAAGMKVK